MTRADAVAPRRLPLRTAIAALFGSRVPRIVIVLLAILVAAEGAYLAVRRVQTPWARSQDGHPPLVGYWQGELTFAPGDRRRVLVHLREFQTVREFLLRGSDTRSDSPQPDIRVVAKACGPTGRAQYQGSGDVANRDGTRFRFGVSPDAPVRGRHPSNLEGTWDGKDRLELAGRLATHAADGSASVTASASARPSGSEDDGVVRFELRRTTEQAFDAAC